MKFLCATIAVLTVGWNTCAAQPFSDAELYYRRTHAGAWPLAGLDPADHSTETTAILAAPMFLPQSLPALPLDGGVDPANLGKGDWLWQIPSCLNALGVGSVQGLIDYEKNRGMKWITVKCGDGGNIWSQFNADLVTRAHAAGLKIFGWAYAYGNNVPGEINVALNALSLGADGFIIDAETEYENLANNSTAAAQYCQGIRAAYPNRFLAHAPFPVISAHSRYPYVTFGRYCDAVMPQAYWADIGGTNYMAAMVTRLNTEWRNWQNSLTGSNTNAIKPIIPIGQGYHSVNGNVTGAAISAFVTALKSNTPSAQAGGYQGVSFWSCQHHSTDMWNAIGAISIGTTNEPPLLGSAPLNRSVDQGASVSFAISSTGAPPLRYQWRFLGTNLPGATNATFVRPSAQLAHTGNYTVVVTNAFGSITSSVALLTVNAPVVWRLVFADDFETNSASRWNLFQGSGNGVSDYTAQWAFDYGTSRYTFHGATNFIPAAPNSTNSTTRGLRLTVNKNDATAATAGVSLYPTGQSFSSDHALRFDLWLNYNGPAGGGSGSTEFATFGLNHDASRVNWGDATATPSDGVWFAMDGEGGAGASSGDYRAYVGHPTSAPALLSFAASGLAANGALGTDASEPFFQALFPAPSFETPGSPGKRWVQGELTHLGGVLTWRLNGVVIAQRTNASLFTNGNVMIGYMDPFTSLASPPGDNFVLFDNVRVFTAVAPPSIIAPPTNLWVNAGAQATFSVTAGGTAPLAYQWRHLGVAVPTATNSFHTITNASAVQAGAYSVAVTNAAGSVTSASAQLNVSTMQITGFTPTNSGWLLSLTGAPGPGYRLEASTNLETWTLLATLTNTSGLLNHLLAPTNSAQGFYRVTAPR